MYAKRTVDVLYAKEMILGGRVAAFPTGTSYGLAVNALSGHALQRLRNIKKRPAEKTFTVYMSDALWDTYLLLTPGEEAVLHRYGNAALTLLVRPQESLAHLAQDGLIGLRVIDHPVMKHLAETTALPLTATSANISGQDPCYTPDEIEAAFPGKDGTTYDLSLACILDGGALKPGRVSTIAQYRNGSMDVMRQGSLIFS